MTKFIIDLIFSIIKITIKVQFFLFIFFIAVESVAETKVNTMLLNHRLVEYPQLRHTKHGFDSSILQFYAPHLKKIGPALINFYFKVMH